MNSSNQSDLWQHYQQTWFNCTKAGTSYKDFAVITAFNPGSTLFDAESNDVAQQKLQRDLQVLGLEYMPVIAGNKDFSYFEPSFAVNCTIKQAMDLALRYQQNALFWVQEDNLWLVPVIMRDHKTTIIGSFSQRLAQ